MTDDIEAIRIHWLAQNEAITRIRELHKPGQEKQYTTTTLHTDGSETYKTETVITCDWCQYLIDNDYYSPRVAPYPCMTIKALDGEK